MVKFFGGFFGLLGSFLEGFGVLKSFLEGFGLLKSFFGEFWTFGEFANLKKKN